jgi:hypothetical protein
MFFPLDFPDRLAHFVGGGLFEQKSHRAGLGCVLTYASSLCAESMSTLVAGRALSTWRVASRPLSRGMAMSISTTAGRSFLASATACGRLALRRHFQIVFEFEHLAKALAHNHMVFRQQNSDSFHINSRFDFSCAAPEPPPSRSRQSDRPARRSFSDFPP